MEIHVFNDQKDLVISPASVIALVREVINFEGQPCHEVSIHFVDTPSICSLHDEYFDDPSPTDCISFPLDEDIHEKYRVLGDVFVCPEAAIHFVAENGGDLYQETSLYVIHGLLHLMGYDDLGEEEKKMRAAESRHMQNVKFKDLFLKR